MQARPTLRAAVWLRPDQLDLLRGVAPLADLEIVAAGSPVVGPSRNTPGLVASELGVPNLDDLRSALATARLDHQADIFWILDPGDFGLSTQSSDPATLLEARAKGLRILSSEPIPASALPLTAGDWLARDETPGAADTIRFVGLMRSARSFREALDILPSFGHVRSLSIESWCTPTESSLGARLFSALDVVRLLVGEPETIDATYVSPLQGSGVHPLPGETLRGLTGDLTANLRFADGRATSIAISDHAGRWNRTLTLLGPSGRLRVYDDGFEWIDLQGQKVDEARHRRPSRALPQTSHAALAMSDSLKRLADPAVADTAHDGPTPLDLAGVLSMAQATLLSARTGQPESPSTIRRMVLKE